MAEERVLPAACGAEAFVALLTHNRADCLFLNSGTDTFPIQEAIAKFESEGRPAPSVVVCPDELVAISAAHGHYLLSRRPQAVLVHVDAGTLQLGGGLHNAQRARAGVVLCAGRAPLTLEGELPGGRNLWIHWMQEQMDQAMGVRGYCRWVYELQRNESIHHVVNRAFQVAATEPAGPVYLTLPREVLMERMTGVRLSADRHRPPGLPDPDAGALQPIAEALAHARRPLILAGYAGRNPAAVPALMRLAEHLGAPVVPATANCLNFPTDHPLWGGISPKPYLTKADAVLVVDCDVPYIPSEVSLRPDAKVFWLDVDPLKSNMPLFTFPADVRLQVDSAGALPALAAGVEGCLTAADRQRHRARAEKLAAEHAHRRREWVQAARDRSHVTPIAPEWLAYCLDRALDPETIVLDETVTNARVTGTMLERTRPGTWFTSGGASLGWALGAAVGVRLAAPERTVAALVGDGAFLFGCPAAALWTAAAHHAPFLAVIFNNEMHFATKRSWLMHYPEGYAKQTNRFIGVDLQPSPDFARLAQACHAFGERVEDPQRLAAALRRGLDAVRGGQAAVLDVRIQRP